MRKINVKNILLSFVALLICFSLISCKSEHKEVSRNIENYGYEVIKLDKLKTVLFYPQFNDESLDKIVHSINEEVKNKLDNSLEATIDYQLNHVNDSLVNLVYDLKYKDSDQISFYSYWIDLSNKELIQIEKLLDQKMLKKISNEIRYECQSQLDESIGFDFTFIEKTMWNQLKNLNLVLTEEKMTIYVNENEWIKNHAFYFSFDLNKIANHLLFETGVIQTEEDPKIDIIKRFVDPNRPMVAITLDDGPVKRSSPRIIDTLEKYGQAATFFMQGFRMEESPQIVIDVINSGSEIASHSYNHKKLTKLNEKELEYQLNEPTRILAKLTDNQVGIRFYRPPYGVINDKISQMSTYSFMLWNIDPEDWKTRDAQLTIDRLSQSDLSDGVVVMHDIYTESADALDVLIPLLVKEGYQLVTLSELFAAKNITPQEGLIYHTTK